MTTNTVTKEQLEAARDYLENGDLKKITKLIAIQENEKIQQKKDTLNIDLRDKGVGQYEVVVSSFDSEGPMVGQSTLATIQLDENDIIKMSELNYERLNVKQVADKKRNDQTVQLLNNLLTGLTKLSTNINKLKEKRKKKIKENLVKNNLTDAKETQGIVKQLMQSASKFSELRAQEKQGNNNVNVKESLTQLTEELVALSGKIDKLKEKRKSNNK